MNKSPTVHPVMLAALKRFYPSLCTLRKATETLSDTGQITQTWADLTGFVNLPCRLAPAGGSGESTGPDQVLTVGMYTCDIAILVVGLTTKERATVNGVEYGIVIVSYDGENPPQATKLLLEKIT